MSGVRRPINLDQAIDNMRGLLEERGGGPCPTMREIKEVTGVAHRHVWDFVGGLALLGVLELDTSGIPPACCRRMRLPKGEWTGWTPRRWSRRAP
jgi:hypothetical protein